MMPLRLDLAAHASDRVGRRADEDDARVGARLREVGVLGEEAVARMDGVGAGPARDVDHRPGWRGTTRSRPAGRWHGLVGGANEGRLAIGIRVDGDGADAHRAAGADHPGGDLAAVRDQDLLQGAYHAEGGYPAPRAQINPGRVPLGRDFASPGSRGRRPPDCVAINGRREVPMNRRSTNQRGDSNSTAIVALVMIAWSRSACSSSMAADVAAVGANINVDIQKKAEAPAAPAPAQ
jgi:hypothetical protein